MVRRERALLAKKDQAVGGMRSIGWEKEDLRQAETWSRTRRRVEENLATRYSWPGLTRAKTCMVPFKGHA